MRATLLSPSSFSSSSSSLTLLLSLLLLLLPSSVLSIPHPLEQRTVSSSSTTPQPTGPTAKLHGATYIGTTDHTYGVDSWLGLRYAQPPVGPLRLQAPVAIQNMGIITAQAFGAQCYQLGGPPTPPNATLAEDCLFANVYAPTGYTGDALPVLFWIHGGGFNDGSGQIYDARSLVQTSVKEGSPTVVVTINYRLSFFGFSAGADVIAANGLNTGLLDQRMALQWVQSNIRTFGGDPRKVTIFGQSAGATSIGLQITAYDGAHEDLFRGAILESGSPQDTSPTPRADWPPYQEVWNAVVEAVGCAASPNRFLCIQSIPAELLFEVIQAVGNEAAPLPSSTFPWQPVVDGSFLSDYPTKLLAEGKFVKLPTIIGFTTDEVTYVIPTDLNISNDTVLAALAEHVLSYVPLPIIEELLVLDPLSEFPNNYDVGGTEWKRTTEIASDLFERCPGRAFARNMTAYAPVWKYRWNAALPAQIASAPYEGIVHASDIPYVFGPSITPYLNAPLDLALSLVVQRAYLSFAANLSPNRLGDLAPGVSWPRYYKDSEEVLVFQKPDGSGEFPNGGFGVPVGQGIHIEKDTDDRPICAFIIGEDQFFIGADATF